MLINITSSDGTTLGTKDKHFSDNITVVPVLDEVNATPSESTQTFTPGTGFAGFDTVKVAPIPSEYVKPAGTLEVTENGTQDVTNYKKVDVNVEPNLEEKTVTITTNGTTEVTPTSGKDGISKVTINTNVPTASAVEEVASASAMDALLVEANVGKYYKFTGTTDSNYTNGDLYLVEGGVVSSHTLTFTSNMGVSATVNGTSVTSPYTLTGNATIIVSCSNDYIEINGVRYTSDETIALSDVDITCNSTLSAPGSVTITINYTA